MMHQDTFIMLINETKKAEKALEKAKKALESMVGYEETSTYKMATELVELRKAQLEATRNHEAKFFVFFIEPNL